VNVQIKELDTRTAVNALLLNSVLGSCLSVAAIGWAVTAESRLDRFFAYSLLFFGLLVLLPTLIARGIRLANALGSRP